MHKITLNEAGLYGLSDPPGWVGERALLSACELKALTVILGDRLTEAQRAQFEIWLNRLFVQLIEDVQKPDRTRSRMDCWRRWNRGNGSGEGNKAPKLSTLVSDELKGLEHKISGLARAVEALSPLARATISTYLQRNGLEDHTSVDIDRTFWRTWGRTDEALLYIQLACERAGDAGGRLPREVRAQLIRVDRAIGTLRARLDGMSDPGREALELSFENHGYPDRFRSRSTPDGADACADTSRWLAFLASVAENLSVEVKRGRDEAVLRSMVSGLAELWWTYTGKEPSRTYRHHVGRDGAPPGEAGDFLQLARILVGFAVERLPDRNAVGTRSLSQIVREVLDERRTLRPD